MGEVKRFDAGDVIRREDLSDVLNDVIDQVDQDLWKAIKAADNSEHRRAYIYQAKVLPMMKRKLMARFGPGVDDGG